MKQLPRRVRLQRRTFFDTRILVAVTGLLLSVILHEFFHLVVHAGNITHIAILPNNAALVEITATVPHGYSTQLEEFIAYSITSLTVICTVIIFAKMGDKKDVRSFSDAVFPLDSPLRTLSKRELFELATKVHIL